MKRIATSLLTLILALSMLLPAAAADEVEYGFVANESDKYLMSSSYSLPHTVEAVIELPKNYEERPGVILGNYVTSGAACFNFEIAKGGKVRFYTTYDGTTTDVTFSDSDVRKGKPVHIAVSYDDAKGTLSLYVDGSFVQSVKKALPFGKPVGPAYRLGGDGRQGNTQYFKGKIYSIALFDDTRSPAEIKMDMVELKGDTEGLIAAWDMTTLPVGELPGKIPDIGPKRRNFNYQKAPGWFLDGGFNNAYDSAFTVIGDTQKVTRYYPEKLSKIYQWIVDNAEKKKIKFCIGLGDMTDTNKDWEWDAVKKAVTLMDGIVPYSIVRGNHDGKDNFKNTFPIYEYRDEVSGTMEGNLLNSYHKFEVNGTKFLVMCLDLAYTDLQMKWANEICEANPDYNVIITTHIYLGDKGTTAGIDAVKYGAKIQPWDVTDKLITKHRNIVMVISGHVPVDNIVVSAIKGQNGNTIRQVLVDPQGLDLESPTGLVATFYFSQNGKKVNIDYFSTIKNKYREGGNHSFLLDLVPGSYIEVTNAPETTAAPDTTAAPETTAPAEGGCGGFVGGSAVILVSILGSAWVSKRR